MHASQKWIRRALLGGVALSVMTTGALAADDLSALKSQLEALQARVNQIEAQPTATTAALPEGVSFISIRRGSDMPGFNQIAQASAQVPTDRGYTISIMPTADMPAPIMEVTISGFVKADFIYDSHNYAGDFHIGPVIGGGDVDNVRFHARESRLTIRSRTDTAIGQIRTIIEMDMFGGVGAFGNNGGTPAPRLRHAWGEWDITPSTTLGFGRFWSLYTSLGTDAPRIDFVGPDGPGWVNRQASVRVTTRSGPWTFAASLEDPTGAMLNASGAATTASDHDLPDAVASITYASGGHIFRLAGVAQQYKITTNGGFGGNDTALGFGVQANMRLALSSMFNLYASAHYGDGDGRYANNNGGGGATVNGAFAAATNINTNESYGFSVGASAKVSPSTSINFTYGYYQNDETPAVTANPLIQRRQSVHLNVMWQPVSKFRLGLEGSWREHKLRTANAAGNRKDDNFRAQFAAWFFF